VRLHGSQGLERLVIPPTVSIKKADASELTPESWTV
jgi:hypothetical protein